MEVIMSDGVLIVCGKRDFCSQLQTIISSSIGGNHSSVYSGAVARRKTGKNEYAAIILAGKLPDEDSLDLAAELATNGASGVMVVVDRGVLFDAHERLDGTGATILSNPLTKDTLIQTIKLVMKFKESGGTLERAKLMLMQKKGWSEPQSHRYIQKVSMDKRLPRDVTAQLVIKALEKENYA
jgi:DNA-binding response OmpR family regulator